MSIRGHFNHQLAQQSRKGHHAPLRSQLVQAAQTADAAARSNTWSRRHQWYWQVDRSQHSGWQAKAKSGPIQCNEIYSFFFH